MKPFSHSSWRFFLVLFGFVGLVGGLAAIQNAAHAEGIHQQAGFRSIQLSQAAHGIQLAPPKQNSIQKSASSCSDCDVNHDGVVDLLDIVQVSARMGQKGAPGWVPEDVNRDGVVDLLDIVEVSACLGKVVGPTSTLPTPTITTTSTITPIPTTTVTGTPTPTKFGIQGNVSLSINPVQSLVSGAGQAVNIDVILSADKPVRSAAAALQFNPAVLSCSRAVQGSFMQDWAAANGGNTMFFPSPTINNTTGVVTAGGVVILGGIATPDTQDKVGGVTGSGVLWTLRCTTRATGVSAISITSGGATDDHVQNPLPYQVALYSGEVFVGVTPTPTPTVGLVETPTMTPTPTPTYMPSETPTSTGTVTPTVTTTPTLFGIPGNVSLSINPMQSLVSGAGQAVNIDVVLSADKPVRSAAAALQFNPAVLNCSRAVQGTFMQDWAAANGGNTMFFPSPTINNTTGVVTDGGVVILGGIATPDTQDKVGGVTGSGVLWTLRCTAKAIGVSAITITRGGATDDHVQNPLSYQVALIPGEIIVGSTLTPTQTGTITVTPNSVGTQTPTTTVTVTPNAIQTQTPTPTPTLTSTLNSGATSTPTQTATVTGTVQTLGSLNLDPAAPTIQLNQSLALNLKLQTNEKTVGTQFEASFNKAVLHCDSVELGTFFNDWADPQSYTVMQVSTPNCDNANGKVTLGSVAVMGVPDGDGASGNGSVYVIHFTGLSAGSSPVTLSRIQVTDNVVVNGSTHTIPVSIGNATVTVSTNSAAATQTTTSTQTVMPISGSTGTPTLTRTVTLTHTITTTPVPTQHQAQITPYSQGVTQVPSNIHISFNPPQKLIAAPGGDSFTVDIQINADKPTRSAGLTVNFDKNIVECVSIKEGTYFKNWAQSNAASTITMPSPVCDNASGKATLNIILLGGPYSDSVLRLLAAPSGTGILGTITFKAKVVGSSQLTLTASVTDNAEQNTKHYVITSENGGIYIGVTPPAATVSPVIGTVTGTVSVLGTPGTPIAPGMEGTGTLTASGSQPVESGTPLVNALGTPITANGSPSSSIPIANGPVQEFKLEDKLDGNSTTKETAQFTSPEGALSISIPAGVQALTKDNHLLKTINFRQITQLTSVSGGMTYAGVGFDLGPSGATFDPPITLQLHYDPAKLPKGMDEKNLVIAVYDPVNKSWTGMKSQVDTGKKLVTTQVVHFSVYALMALAPFPTMQVLMVGSIVLEILAVVGLVFYMRRRKKVTLVKIRQPVIYYLPAPKATPVQDQGQTTEAQESESLQSVEYKTS